VVTFASPSALKVWTSRLGKDYKVACIGETTATAAREAGWERIYYPTDKPGLDGWAASVLEALAEPAQ
jgi:uroporphyrinogen-III synthase